MKIVGKYFGVYCDTCGKQFERSNSRCNNVSAFETQRNFKLSIRHSYLKWVYDEINDTMTCGFCNGSQQKNVYQEASHQKIVEQTAKDVKHLNYYIFNKTDINCDIKIENKTLYDSSPEYVLSIKSRENSKENETPQLSLFDLSDVHTNSNSSDHIEIPLTSELCAELSETLGLLSLHLLLQETLKKETN